MRDHLPRDPDLTGMEFWGDDPRPAALVAEREPVFRSVRPLVAESLATAPKALTDEARDFAARRNFNMARVTAEANLLRQIAEGMCR